MCLTQVAIYVQIKVVVLIEDDFQQVFVKLFLFCWFKELIYWQDNQSRMNYSHVLCA